MNLVKQVTERSSNLLSLHAEQSGSDEWGNYVINAGFASVVPGSDYPPCPHPKDHHFKWENGRTLPNYCFLYITQGAGELEFSPGDSRPISSGDLVVLHANAWHRYRPAPDTGWQEYWLEFAGDHAARLMKPLDSAPNAPVTHIGIHQPLLSLYTEALDLLRNEPPAYQLMLGALATQIIARTVSAMKTDSYNGRPVESVIREAKRLLASQPTQHKRLDRFAEQLNLSYTNFRRLFKAETGYSPPPVCLGSPTAPFHRPFETNRNTCGSDCRRLWF